MAKLNHCHPSLLMTETKTFAQKAIQSALMSIFGLGGRVG
jgi:hypothetical protein